MGDTATGRGGAMVVACLVATIAFYAYTRTLLRGVDLGDTGGFQAAVLWPEISARQAYPLYFGLARPLVGALTPSAPALGLNLFSAIWAAVACGVLAWIAARVGGSLAGGMTAGLLLAFSYTFWTQAVIAEVYSLHLALVAACLVALHGWSERPSSMGRLAAFFAVYAVSFGNHLSMLLLLAPFGLYLLMARQGVRLLRPGIVVLAAGIAFAGALQYVPQLVALWRHIGAPPDAIDRLAAFWFDVTKADWRDSMVLGIGTGQLPDRLAMLWFDARQQFGLPGLALAAAGLVRIWRISRPWGALAASAYAINTGFALTYNVGDAHVFFLPGHFFTALLAGAALPPFAVAGPRRALVAGMAVLTLCYAVWRGYDTWPAADRHADRRAEALVSRMALGLNERDTLLVTHLNWQIENALLYHSRFENPRLVWVRLSEVLLHFPALVRDNHMGDRDVVLTADAASDVVAAYGPLFPLVPDPLPPVRTLARVAAQLPRGAPYIVGILAPAREDRLDEDALAAALSSLTGGRPPARQNAAYEVFAGVAGEPVAFHRASSRPFRARFRVADQTFAVRMDGWLPAETFRRGGFGHVSRGRQPILALERGVSFVALERDGSPAPPFYEAGLYADRPRLRIPRAGVPQLASERPGDNTSKLNRLQG